MKWKNKGHEFDDIGNKLKDKRNIYLYGIGGNFEELFLIFDFMKKNNFLCWEIHLVDKDVNKPFSVRHGYKIMSPNEFFSAPKENYFVVVCPSRKPGKEIYELLLSNNIDEELIYSGDYFLYTYLSVYFIYQYNIVFFTSQNMLPSTVCNLNCRDCLNFTPYIKNHITDNLSDLKRNVDLFFNAVDYIYRFQITGGEPLLYKNLQDIFQYIDEKYRSQIIRLELVTNGTIIPSDDLCEFLAKKNIYLFLDDYREAMPNTAIIHDKIEEKLKNFGVNYVNNYVSKWIRLYNPDLMPPSKNVKELCNLFNICGNPWSCLWQGKISSCNYGMYAAKAGVCEDDKDEYYDLANFTPDKKHELIEFRLRYNSKGYINLCKKCHGWTSINPNWCQAAVQEKK